MVFLVTPWREEALLDIIGVMQKTQSLVGMAAGLASMGKVPIVVMPAAAVGIAGDRVGRSRGRLESWKHGPGVFKVDWALNAPIPWSDPWSTRAGTVHVGGTLSEVVAAEAAAAEGLAESDSD